MKKDKIILNSFKESFLLIKKNKMLFLVLFLLQLLFFSLIFIVNFQYQTKILESVSNVMDYISKQDPAESNILGDDPLMIHRNYKNIVYNLKLLTFWCLLIFIIINGSIFYLISRLIYNKNLKNIFKCQKSKISEHAQKSTGFLTNYKKIIKEFFIYLFKFGIVSVIFFLLIFLFTYSSSKVSIFNLISGIASFNPASLLVAFILFYFMYLTFSLIYKIEFKDIFKELFNVGVKKAHILLLTYFIILIIILILFLLIAFLIEKNIVLLSLGVLLFILSFVLGKIFLVIVVKKLVS